MSDDEETKQSKKYLDDVFFHECGQVHRMSNEKLDKINDIDAKIESLEGMRRVLLGEWASEMCPHSVGEIVPVYGYSHNGKKCLVEKIGWRKGFSGRYEWTVFGRVVLKDGNPGKNAVSWTEIQDGMDSLADLSLLLEIRCKLLDDLVYASPEQFPAKERALKRLERRICLLLGRIKWVEG